jgi:hypothetical protein
VLSVLLGPLPHGLSRQSHVGRASGRGHYRGRGGLVDLGEGGGGQVGGRDIEPVGVVVVGAGVVEVGWGGHGNMCSAAGLPNANNGP